MKRDFPLLHNVLSSVLPVAQAKMMKVFGSPVDK